MRHIALTTSNRFSYASSIARLLRGLAAPSVLRPTGMFLRNEQGAQYVALIETSAFWIRESNAVGFEVGPVVVNRASWNNVK